MYLFTVGLFFFHDCRKRKYFNLCSVWCPAVLENIFCFARAKTLACLIGVPREQGWHAVETWVSLEVASSLCQTTDRAVAQHSDLCGPLHPSQVGFAAVAQFCAALPRHAAWPWSLCHLCELILSLFRFVLLLLLLLGWKEHYEMVSLRVSGSWNPFCA